ncbi:MAG: DUF115 domain-containing protein [Deltaproteobacteria bacterium]|nr:DUF115 domain-containing protein [Deltaproteobacteria bacterium]
MAVESNDITGQFAGVSFLDEIPVALDVKCHPKLWQLPARGFFGFTGPSMPAAWILRTLGAERSVISVGGSVATAAFSVIAQSGADPIILIGQDLAYSDTGALHAEGIGLLGAEDLSDEERRAGADALARKGFFEIEGYGGGRVLTKTNLRSYLLWFERSVKAVTGAGRRAINCTEGGAKIAGFEQRPLGETLESLPRLAIDPRAEFLRYAVRRTPDVTPLARALQKVERDARRLKRTADDLLPDLERAIRTARDAGAEALAPVFRKAERADRTVTPLIEFLAPLLDPLCNTTALVAETAFDYAGLDDAQQARMNLRQTYTLYAGLSRGARDLLGAARSFREKHSARAGRRASGPRRKNKGGVSPALF